MNKQEDYAKCLQIIESIREGGSECPTDTDFLCNIFFAACETPFPQITNLKSVNSYGDLINVPEDYTRQYIFQVDCSNENDMVNLIYYCLVRDELDGNSILCIESNYNSKLIANVRDLLSDQIYSKNKKEVYTIKDGVYRVLSINAGRNTKRFSPIYQIDEKKESAAYWGQSVHNFLLNLYKENPIEGSEYEYGTNYFLPRIIPKLIREKGSKTIWNNKKSDKDIRLINIMLECFCTQEKSKKRFVKSRYERWITEEFYNLVKDIPLLAMYIFCVFDYFLKNEVTDSLDSIQEEIFNARDMADGVLQIIENIYHSEKKKGFFCFRVHNDSIERSQKYLLQNYKEYINRNEKDKKEIHDYLEVKIVDFSHATIPEKFFSNFVKRMLNADEDDQIIYKEIQSQAREITVKSFFQAIPFWQKYNMISENVVHHYGLQVFDSFVSCYEGYFRVRSRKEYYKTSTDMDNIYSTIKGEENVEPLGFPGTQYDIVIPFKKHKALQNIALNVNINYTDYLLDTYKPRETIDFTTDSCKNVFKKIQDNNSGLSYQEKKEKTIHELESKLSSDLEGIDQHTIVHFSANKIAPTMIEMFCKTVMLYIAKKPQEFPCYIMITNCSQSHFVEITRMLALFYDKQGTNTLMFNTQIFLSGQPGEEFLISGCNLGEVIGGTEKLAFSRCINPDCLKILKRMLRYRNSGSNPNDMISIVPFDMIRYDINVPTLFESNLKQVLETEVQSEKFGCRIANLHVRIGSKIHIKKFYEAELLFHNNYYTSRFAYWLLEDICSNKDIDLKAQITLVGYENYSEMLLNELREMLEVKNIYADYIIYEQKATEKFRAGKSMYEYRNSQFVLIVPINSTLTTHIKVAGFLKKSIREELKKHGQDGFSEYELPRAIYYGIILVSPEESCHNEYWKRDEFSNNIIISSIDHNKMKYFMEVQTKWSHPLGCKDCFPSQNYTKEIPLIETDKESVVPMQAIGMKRSSGDNTSVISTVDETSKLKELSNFLVYKHIERNGNHFNYYFCTEKLWDYQEIRRNIQDWLDEKSNLFPTETQKTYDIIVAPLHYSNTAFVEEVNHHLFKNVALVLHFDADKEFRMNVKAKYSSIQQLYDNLCEGDENSIINFHYVDDTIISGRTYHRTRSIIRSLITNKDGAKVTINLFRSVVVLINRLSPSSVKEYLDDQKYYLAYYNLNISSMRVNEDACVLCKKHKQWNKLAEQASLNEVYLYWKKKSEKLECKSVEELGKIMEEDSAEKQERATQYMIASHRAKSLLEPICDYYNNVEIGKKIVEILFPDKIGDSPNEFIAMLKVLGRPFLTYRREIKESVFELMLTMLDQLLKDTEPEGDDKLNVLLKELWNSPINRTQIIVILVNRLTELESNYIIRKKSMRRLLDYAEYNFNEGDIEEKEKFKDNYLNRVKQLVGQSNDFAKGLFLEYLLLYGEEYNEKYAEDLETKEMVSLAEHLDITTFKRKLYLENTKLIDYGIEALAWSFEYDEQLSEKELVKELKNNYYLDNFVQYLAFHKMVRIDRQGEITKFYSADDAQRLEGMIRFQILYREVFKELSNKEGGRHTEPTEDSEANLKDIFQRMLGYLKIISGALDAEIVVPYFGSIENVKKYIALGFGERADVRTLNEKEDVLFNFMENNPDFEGNTYSIHEYNNKKWIIIKFYDAAQQGSRIPMIFLLFTFAMGEEKMLLHSLKNTLVFRNKIWRLLNLSSSTLLQNWTDNLYYKQQMLKNKATAHKGYKELYENLETISKVICKSDRKEDFLPEYFSLLVDSLIGYMNAQVLGGRGKDYLNHRGAKFCELWRGYENICKAMCKIWMLDLNISDSSYLANLKIRKGTEFIKYIPEAESLLILFLAVFQNAEKHGKRNENGKIVISIYREGERLCISNEVDNDEKNRARQSIRPDEYRKGSGISQAVIFDMCRGWYSDTEYEEIFKIEPLDGKVCNYVVKLPIIERQGEA